MTTPVLDVANLHVRFTGRHRQVHAVRGVDLKIHPGEAVAIVGESGSGKSVTARTLVGLAGDHAEVHADRFDLTGQDVRGLGEHGWRKLRGKAVGLVLQDALTSLDPLRTVRQEVAEPLRLHTTLSRADRGRRVEELLEEVGFPDAAIRAGQYSHQLSGGLRQRALIASAIAAEPPLLVADEPTTALDVTVQAQILDLLAQRRDQGTALLLISHDLAVVARVADRVLVLRDGVVVEQGPVKDLLRHPQHDYTKQLLRAVPSAATRGQRLSTLGEATTTPPARRDRLKEAAAGPVLQAERVSKAFQLTSKQRIAAVRGVDVTVRPGQKLGIVGESGSGKSTLARLLLGLIPPDEGVVKIKGQDVATADRDHKRELCRAVQFVSQDPFGSFDPRYSVRQIISEPLIGRPLAEREERVREVMALAHVDDDLLDAVPRTLSGGQRQRVSIARALALAPEVLVCDEPVSALDVSIQAQILDLLAELNEATGTALVFISHDLGVVHHLVDDVIVMERGDVREAGPVERVFSDPQDDYTKALLAALPRLEVESR
jgi:peptide/nickel transport system ATP-binding protein